MTGQSSGSLRKEAQVLSFNNDPKTKKKYLARVRAHKKADEIVQGYYWNDGKGCAVGCTIHGADHLAYQRELGLSPAWAYLEDSVFEHLSVADSKWWPEAFLAAVPVGKDLWPAYHRVIQRILLEIALPNVRAANEPEPSASKIEAVIRTCANLYAQCAAGSIESPTRAYWRAFQESAAGSAAESAAESAAGSAAGSAAWSAAESAAGSAAESAAWSAAWSAAGSAAESAARSAARSAAESATESAAWSAAGSAAWSAAESAAESAAWSAAGSAAWSAAGSAAWSAAWSAAYKRIADIIIQELQREGDSP